MNIRFRYVILIFITAVFLIPVKAQDLNQTLSKLTQDAASSYVAPVVSGFGADLNSGWITSVPNPVKFGLNFNFRIVAMGAFFKDANKSFSKDATFRFNSSEADLLVQSIQDPNVQQQVKNQILSQTFTVGMQGPTIIGNKNDYITLDFKGATINGQTIAAQKIQTDINGALDGIPLMPLVAPQLTFGTVFGSSLSIRYLPSIKLNSDLGDFSYFGIGVMHNPAVWMQNPLPLNVAVGLFTQTMKVGDIFKVSATSFGVFAGKTFGIPMLSVSPYGGLSIETSTITVNYIEQFDTPTGPKTENISFDLKGDNSVKFTVGATFNLAVVSLNIDYGFASYNTVSAGIGFGL